MCDLPSFRMNQHCAETFIFLLADLLAEAVHERRSTSALDQRGIGTDRSTATPRPHRGADE
jgi:hypothetical protein